MTNYTPDPKLKAERALPLNERIGRIAQSLADTFFGRDSEPSSDDGLEEVVAASFRAWRDRGEYVPEELLSDPAWGMLLELFHAELGGKRVSISRICWASAKSIPAAMRWLKVLEERGLVLRRADSDHAGKESVELTSKGSAALRGYFREVMQRSEELR